MKRNKIIAGNWKMFKTNPEALELINGIEAGAGNIVKTDIVVCPPFTALSTVAGQLNSGKVFLGAQNIFWEEEGAFTGEISPAMLKSAGASYAIIGHSERRQYFGETEETVNKRVKAALAHGLKPIVCVGETLEQREANITADVVLGQIKGGLIGLIPENMANVVIAYEPVWAIGTGKTATPEQAQEVHAFIRKTIEEMFDTETAENIRIQYGGSVKPENAEILLSQPDIDGALVGGACLKADSFLAIINAAEKL